MNVGPPSLTQQILVSNYTFLISASRQLKFQDSKAMSNCVLNLNHPRAYFFLRISKPSYSGRRRRLEVNDFFFIGDNNKNNFLKLSLYRS